MFKFYLVPCILSDNPIPRKSPRSDHSLLDQWLAYFFCKGPDSNFSRPYGPYSCSYSTVPLYCDANCREHVNERAWLCSNKIIFTKNSRQAGVGPQVIWLLTPVLDQIFKV